MFIQFVAKCPAPHLDDCTRWWVVMNVWIRCKDNMAARCLTLVPTRTPLVAIRILMDFKVFYRVGSIRVCPLGLSDARKNRHINSLCQGSHLGSCHSHRYQYSSWHNFSTIERRETRMKTSLKTWEYGTITWEEHSVWGEQKKVR